MFTTYILYSESTNSFYTGQTADLPRRLEEHNRGKTAFMKKGKPWTLVFSRELNSRSEATQLESKIKKRGAGRFIEDEGIVVG